VVAGFEKGPLRQWAGKKWEFRLDGSIDQGCQCKVS